MTELFDVIATNFETNRVRVLDTNKTLPNAEAIVSMAVIRRCLGEEWFDTCHSGKYNDGDLRE